MKEIFFASILILLAGSVSAATIIVDVHAATSLTLYAGDKSTSGYGFGDSASSISSPGPTLNLVEGTTYTMTVYNVGTMPHAWEIVPTKATSTSPTFGAGIDITNYIPVGDSGTVTFTPDKTGNFYYVCTFPGHIALGMWGTVSVTSPSVPEFPTALTLIFVAVAVTAMAGFLARQKNRGNKFQNF